MAWTAFPAAKKRCTLLSIARAGPWSAHPPRCSALARGTGRTVAGRLFCGTPVRILKEAEQWCEVAVGTDDRLSGWVPREQLAFGHDMDQIKSAFSQKILREEYQGRPMYASPDMQSACLLEEGAWMVGTAGDGLYILLTSIGDTFFAPQTWFEEGRG